MEKPLRFYPEIILSETKDLTLSQFGGLMRLMVYQMEHGGFNTHGQMREISGLDDADLKVLTSHPFFVPITPNIKGRFIFRGITQEL